MENQHRKITGYRELSQEEIDLMNEIKALGPQIEAVIIKVAAHLKQQYEEAAVASQRHYSDTKGNPTENYFERLDAATPDRFLQEGTLQIQVALMLLTRAVAQPTFF